MFGKLLKYEFKFIGKWYLLLYAAGLALSLMFGLLLASSANTFNSFFTSSYLTAAVVLLITAILFILISIFLASLIIIIRQFYSNIFGREGYLTLTLPVSSHQLLLAKLTAAIIFYLLSSLVILLGIFLITLPLGVTFDNFLTFFAEIDFISLFDISLFLFNSFLGMIVNILLIYLAIAIGQLFQNHRLLLAFIFYFLISIGLAGFYNIGQGVFLTYINFNYYLILQILINLIEMLAFYFITHSILKYKINLQ